MNSSTSTLDHEEVQQFAAIASEWWDYNGKFRPLHVLSPTRLGYINEQICSHFKLNSKSSGCYDGLKMLDIGCGGGLVAEPLARLRGDVTAIDPAEENIEAAKIHAKAENLTINYRSIRVEDLVSEDVQFDVVVLLEVVEHVPDVSEFVQVCSRLVRPGGLFILSTLNRTLKSYALAIVGAEYVLRWVPAGTHQWDRFVKPAELATAVEQCGLEVLDKRGMAYNPIKDSWALSHDMDVNYFLTCTKPAEAE
ncbi:MAG: bifunctional 2-polyprenyl-6-hydroxyphenol methylase/3-demethylubiquinol 3-O-methyltransferase UbiG [Methyloligellaceae bacterium]